MHRGVLRADPAVRRRRRATVIRAAVQLVVAVLLVVWTLSRAVKVGPSEYRVGTAGGILVVTGGCLFGVSMVLLLRSPLRMSVGERLFRSIWLGPMGRAFLNAAIRV